MNGASGGRSPDEADRSPPSEAMRWEEAEVFIQVIQGKVADAEGVRAAMDRWGRDLQPGATGWLGTTGGITDDGMVRRDRAVRLGRGRSAQQ